MKRKILTLTIASAMILALSACAKALQPPTISESQSELKRELQSKLSSENTPVTNTLPDSPEKSYEVLENMKQVTEDCGDLLELAKGDFLLSVTGDVCLAAEYEGKSVTWTSSNEEIVSTNGHVNRPEDVSERVTLTATVGSGSDAQTFEYNLRVVKSYLEDSVTYYDENMVLPANIEAAYIFYDDPESAVIFANDDGTLRSANMPISSDPVESVWEAMYALYSFKDLLGIEHFEDEIYVKEMEEVMDGYIKITYGQVRNGIDVQDGIITVITDSDGNSCEITNHYKKS